MFVGDTRMFEAFALRPMFCGIGLICRPIWLVRYFSRPGEAGTIRCSPDEVSSNTARLCGTRLRRLLRRRQRDRGFAGKDAKNECLLEIQPHSGIRVVEIANRNILSEGELEIAAARGQDERTFDGWRPDQIAVDDTLDVLQDGVSVIAGFGERGVFVGSEQDRVRAVHADE